MEGRPMDEADVTQQREEMMEELRQKEHYKNNKHKISVDCIDCGGHIPEARQAATDGTEYCVNCAEINEIRGRK